MNHTRFLPIILLCAAFLGRAAVRGEDSPRSASGSGAESKSFGGLQFLRALQAWSETESALVRAGDDLARKGDYKGAIDSYTLDLNVKENPQTRYRRAYSLALLKKYELAIEDCTQILAADPKDFKSLELRAWGLVKSGKLSEAVSDYEALATAQPTESSHCYALGTIREKTKDFARAKECYERAIHLSPHDPQAYLASVRCLLMLKETDRAVEQVTALLKSNPRQAGGYARVSAFSRKLSDDDLKHGYEQLWAMLRDRPQMAAGLGPKDSLYEWAARKFAGEDITERIRWDSSEPQGAEADHESPRDGRPGRVRVASRKRGLLGLLPGQRLTFDESWARVCYELHNIQGTPDFEEAEQLGRRGDTTRDGYVRQYAFVEYKAALRTRAFYTDVYFPLAKEKKIETSPHEWYAEIPPTFDDWLARYTDQSGYPWVPYGTHYDRLQEWRAYNQKAEGEKTRSER